MNRITQAHIFALAAHGNQKRKFTEEPYSVHFEETAQLLWEITEGKADHDMYVAAILHDVVEDTDTTLEEIGQNFGGEVMNIVNELTINEAMRKKEGKQVYMTRKMNEMSGPAFLIKLCDRFNNVSGLGDKRIPNTFVSSYIKETQYILDGLNRVVTETQAKLINKIQNTLLYIKLNRDL